MYINLRVCGSPFVCFCPMHVLITDAWHSVCALSCALSKCMYLRFSLAACAISLLHLQCIIIRAAVPCVYDHQYIELGATRERYTDWYLFLLNFEINIANVDKN